MRIAIPHKLGRDAARARVKARSHEIAGLIPGGIAQVDHRWDGEDRMILAITAMGRNLAAQIDVEDAALVFVMDLPVQFAFIEGAVASAIHEKGTKLLS